MNQLEVERLKKAAILTGSATLAIGLVIHPDSQAVAQTTNPTLVERPIFFETPVLPMPIATSTGRPFRPVVGPVTLTPIPVDSNMVRLSGDILDILPQATLLEYDANKRKDNIAITIVLQRTRQGQADFDAYLAQLNQTPADERVFLNSVELANRFGPSQEAYNRMLRWMLVHGFTLTDGSTNRLTQTYSGTRGLAERAFELAINDYIMGARAFYANNEEPAVPRVSAGDVQAVIGLNNFSHPFRPQESNLIVLPTSTPTINHFLNGRRLGSDRVVIGVATPTK